MNRLITLSFFLLLCVVADAQIAQLNPKFVSVKQYEAEANKAFEKRQYNKALEYYSIILKDQPQRTDLYWNAAISAYQTKHYTVAFRYLESLNQPEYAKLYPQLMFKRAMVKKSLGDYDGAITLLKTFIANSQIAGTNSPTDLVKEAEAEILACEWAKPLNESKPGYDVIRMDEINTNFTDMAPVQYGDKLYFTSSYKASNDSLYVTHIYQADTRNKVESVDINSMVSGEFTSHYALNTNQMRVYYNIGKEVEGTYSAEIYYRDKGTDGLWKAPVRLPDAINMAGYTATQPNVGFDKATGREILYFVSDRPGGKGGLDIWAAEIDAQGNIGMPKNLSEINTTKDDITPFHFNMAQVLFFSTEGYKTMGGFDVFSSTKNSEGLWSLPTHGGFPLNSSYDDMYYSINENTGRSFFVSNRKGGKCFSPDRDCVCNDIYYYDIQLNLKAETFLVTTKEPLKATRVELINLDTDKSMQTLVNKDGNNFDFALDKNTRYRLIATKENHIADTVDFDTKGYWQSTTIYQKLELMPNLKLDVYVFEKFSNIPLSGSRVDIFEMPSGFTISSSSSTKTSTIGTSPNSYSSITGSYTTGKLIFSEVITGHHFTTGKIEFGKTYKLFGFKDTYAVDSSYLVIDAYGASTRYEYSDSLFLQPFKGLPLTLFFDDDHPNPRTRDSFTNLSYDNTYNAYILKEMDYLRANYGQSKSVSFSGANEISAFFRDSVRGNYQKLREFSALMTKFLAAGQNLEIVIEGYASPLADSDYNKLLTSRRINSLINSFYYYENGILRPYIQNKHLSIRIIPFGETKASSGVSDDFNDQKSSIYSIGAMRERKVQIKEINQLTDEEVRRLSSIDHYDILKKYWDFDTHLSFLDKNLAVEASMENKTVTPASANRVSTIVTTKSGVTTKGGASLRMRHEFVLVDSYTGETITKEGNVQVYDYLNQNKAIGKAKLKNSVFGYDFTMNGDYLITGRARGYSEASAAYLGSYTEGGGILRDTLYLTPFTGLPLSLYFNNDRPDPNTTSTTTNQTYDKTYKSYYGQKKEFIKQYNQLLSSIGGVPMADNEMQQFFDDEIKGGFDKLSGYASIIKSYLKQGKQIEIVIEGHASPLANSNYNDYLTSRRIQSVVNFLAAYDGGSLKKYLKSGNLEVKNKPLGETESSNVSDDIKDPKRSIYGLGASKARRVVIRDILIREVDR